MLTGYLLIWTVVLFACIYLSNKEKIYKSFNLPSPPTVPIFGNALMFLGKPEKIFRVINDFTKQYERLVAIWMGPWLNIFLFDPNDVEVVLKASRNMNKAFQYNFLRPWLGDSILLSTGAKFRQNKKILVKTFHVNNLKQYLPIFNNHAVNLIKHLEVEIDNGEFDIHGYLSLCTMHTLLETSLGVDKELLGQEAINYANAVEKVGRYCHMRVYKIWLYPELMFNRSSLKRNQDKYLKVLNSLTDRVIAQRKKEYETRKSTETPGKVEENEDRKIFVDNFFESTKENGEHFTDKEIKDEVMTMMFAGQDTTTVSVGFALSLLGIYTDIQDKVMEELNEIYQGSQRYVTYEDTQKLKYMEQVIQETWRLFPPIPVIAKTPSENLQLDGCVLPKNSTVAIIIMLLHRNPKVYPNPNKFNPDNFLPERIKERHPCSFIPFSSGYRTCIGPKYAMLVIKVVLCTILRNYRVVSKRQMRDFKLAAQTTLKRKEGFLISIEPRVKN